jgi:hypothetical protein
VREDEFSQRLREITERFVKHESSWDELWRTFCLGFYADEVPEGFSGPSASYWAEIYELVYMSQPGIPVSKDRAVGLLGEEELREALARYLARTVAKEPA